MTKTSEDSIGRGIVAICEAIGNIVAFQPVLNREFPAILNRIKALAVALHRQKAGWRSEVDDLTNEAAIAVIRTLRKSVAGHPYRYHNDRQELIEASVRIARKAILGHIADDHRWTGRRRGSVEIDAKEGSDFGATLPDFDMALLHETIIFAAGLERRLPAEDLMLCQRLLADDSGDMESLAVALDVSLATAYRRCNRLAETIHRLAN